jgi:hypothetical protein
VFSFGVTSGIWAGGTTEEKTAEIVVSTDIVIEQEPVPLHAPDHPKKVEPPFGEAERMIEEPEIKTWEQLLPQEIPPPFTVPLPVPLFETVRV